MANIQEYLDTAKGAIISGTPDRAIAICEHVLCQFPKHLEAHCLLAEAWREHGELQKAEDLFLRVLSADPERLIARWALAIIYDERGEREAAVGQLRLALEASPDHGELRKEVVRLSGQRPKLTAGGLARIYARGGLFDRAAAEYRSALTREPARLDLMVGLAEALWQGGRPQEAAEECRKVLRESPDCLKALLILSLIEAEQGAGQDVLGAARALDPEDRVLEAMVTAAGIKLGNDIPLCPVSLSLPDPIEDGVMPEMSTAGGWGAAGPRDTGESRGMKGEAAVAAPMATSAEEKSVEDELAGLGDLVEDAEYEELSAAATEAEQEESGAGSTLIEQPTEYLSEPPELPAEDAVAAEDGEASETAVTAVAETRSEPAEAAKTVPNWMPDVTVNEDAYQVAEVVDDTSWAKWADLLSEEITLDPAAEARLAAALSEVQASAKSGEAGAGGGDASKVSGPDEPLDPTSRLARAESYRQAEQIDEAVSEYKVLLGSAPQLNEAVTAGLRDIIRQAPNHAQAHRLLGDAYMKAGHFQQAIDEYGRALSLEKAAG